MSRHITHTHNSPTNHLKVLHLQVKITSLLLCNVHMHFEVRNKDLKRIDQFTARANVGLTHPTRSSQTTVATLPHRLQ
jgi:hypothetical protein